MGIVGGTVPRAEKEGLTELLPELLPHREGSAEPEALPELPSLALTVREAPRETEAAGEADPEPVFNGLQEAAELPEADPEPQLLPLAPELAEADQLPLGLREGAAVLDTDAEGAGD